MEELWIEIPTEPGFFVSNYGKVRKGTSPYNLFIRKNRYVLSINRKREGNKFVNRQYNVGKLVLSLFTNTRHTRIRYKNGDTLDNRLDNLEWIIRISSQEKYRRSKIASEKLKQEDPAMWHSIHMAMNANARIVYAEKRKPSYVGREFGFSSRAELTDYLYKNFKTKILALLSNNEYPTIDRIDNS